MKTSTTPHRLLIPLLSLSLLAIPGVRAQDQETNAPTNAESTNSTANCPPDHPWHHHHGDPFANLTEAERQEIKADLQKIKEDPKLVAAREAVESARKALNQTRDELLIEVDPSVQTILDKLHKSPPPQPPEGAPAPQ